MTLKCFAVISLHVVMIQIIHTNSKTSQFWKLNSEMNIIEASTLPKLPYGNEGIFDDPIFNIIVSTVHYGESWTKKSPDNLCIGCKKTNDSQGNLGSEPGENSEKRLAVAPLPPSPVSPPSLTPPDSDSPAVKSATSPAGSFSTSQQELNKTNSSHIKYPEDDEVLDCGKPVNFTYYDNLVGIANRLSHPNVPEPQISLIFKKKTSDIDVTALERKLKKAKREKPKSVQLYNQIGNFWRLKGDTYKSIECFRRALAVSPHNAEVLLNLARVLFTLQYLDDAIYLTRRSLEVQPPDKSAWQQYFTLGEIFKAYGHYQEASLHMKHCLQLRPGFEPALSVLKEMESSPDNNIHVYTLLIIVCLVLGVLLVIISSLDSSLEGSSDGGAPDGKSQNRHFNRALAMRSLKMGISPRAMRSKRYSGNSG